MIRYGTRLGRKAIALAASTALAAGSIVATASTATAAPGDTSTFLMSGGVVDIAEGPEGNIWVTGDDGTISKIGLDRQMINYAARRGLGSIAQGPSGSMWFTNLREPSLGRISTDGAIQYYPTGVNGAIFDIARGADGNMWFTDPSDNQVGKITPGGDVTLYSTGGAEMYWVTPGPVGSNRMYLGSLASGSLGFITFDGSFTEIPGPAGVLATADLLRINDQIWSTQVLQGGATTQLARLVADSSFTTASNPALERPHQIGAGTGDTMWVGSIPGPTSRVSHVRTNGVVVATYNVPAEPEAGMVQAQDGTVWFGSNRTVYRMTTELVPTSTAAPAVEPTTGLVAGSSATVTNGSWTYLPGNYAYQWQVCGSSDAASCADVAGATAQSYTVATTDVGKYIRAGVRASNLNGASQPAYSALVATGAAPAPVPDPNPTPVPATGEVASVGNGVVMELDAPSRQKRGKKKWYEVAFSASDVQGTVVFEFSKGNRTKTKTVTVEDGFAEYRWKTPRKWRKGRTTVTATFVPSAGSPYTAAEVRDRVRIR